MILIDASVIIDFWRQPTEDVKQVFYDNKVVISGITRAELYHGAKDKNQLLKIQKALSDFEEIHLDVTIWEKLGINLFSLRSNGITVPFQDALLATLAIENNLRVWALDKHFNIMQVVLVDLKLFELKKI